jgi:hypothetical protein
VDLQPQCCATNVLINKIGRFLPGESRKASHLLAFAAQGLLGWLPGLLKTTPEKENDQGRRFPAASIAQTFLMRR